MSTSSLVLRIAVALAAAYAIGGIPWALIIGKRFFGIDPREHGSGNLGATNVFRVLGARASIVTLVLDAGKGALAVALGLVLVPASAVSVDARDWVLIACGIAAIAGHSFSPYIRLRGGKGVATAAGVIAVLMPLSWPLLFLSFILIVYLWHMVSLGSVLIALEFPVLALLLYRHHPAFVVFAFIVAALVAWRHRSNLVRIAHGEERKISLSRRGEARRDVEGE